VLDTDPLNGPLHLNYRLKMEMRYASGGGNLFTGIDTENRDGGVHVDTDSGQPSRVLALQQMGSGEWISVELRRADHDWQMLAYGGFLTTDRNARRLNVVMPKPRNSPSLHYEAKATTYLITGPCVTSG
jgi:hypothetical protein